MQAKQIVQLASWEAKGGTGMVNIAGQDLNVVLEDLKINRNLKMNQVTQFITVIPGGYGPFKLEADYLRTYDLFYPLPVAGGATSSSMTQFLTPVTMEQFDAEFKSPSVSNYPYEFATDLSTQAQIWDNSPTLPANTTPGLFTGIGNKTSAGQMFIYPQTSGALVLTHRYMVNQPDLTTPETSNITPWFPFTDYLIVATAARLMGVTGDDRRDSYFANADKLLRPYLIMDGDEQSAIHDIKLDPRKFKFIRNLKPTKASPM